MKISVIVPVYNVQAYLGACIESILKQTYSNLEIILVDDGSSDRSGEICDLYAKNDSRIIVVHKKNGGVSAARNTGIELSSGDYITFVDSDDTIDPDMYELLLDFALQYDADIAHCGYKHIVGEEVRLVHDTKEVIIQNEEEALRCLIGGIKFGGSLWNKLFRRSLVADLRLREDIKTNEDILYNFEAFRRCSTTVFADYAKYNYIARVNESSCFVTPRINKLKDSCMVRETIYHGVENTSLSQTAGEQYIRALSGMYRYYAKAKDKNKYLEIAHELWDVCKNESGIRGKMKLTALLIHFCPWGYRVTYKIYDKIRKPNWEV